MKNLRLSWLCLSVCFSYNALAQATLFSQNFNSSNTLSDYVNASAPSGSQFTNIVSTQTPENVISISGGALQFARTQAFGSMRAIRNFAFSGPPTSLYLQFSFAANSTNSSTGTVPASFYVGNNFTNTATTPANADTFGEVGFDFPAIVTANTFRVRANGTYSSNFAGTQQITWVLNNTGKSLNYVRPGGGSATVANTKSDFWVGNTLIFDELSSTGGDLSHFEFFWKSSASNQGQFTFDDFLIRDVSGILPINIDDIKAESLDNTQVEISWRQNSILPLSHFVVSRSQDAIVYAPIAQIEVNNNPNYFYKDNQAKAGLNYYKISQISNDGQIYESRPVAIILEPQKQIMLLPNPSDGTICFLQTDKAQNISVYNTLGLPVDINTEIYQNGIYIKPQKKLKAGVYLIQWQEDATLRQCKWSVY